MIIIPFVPGSFASSIEYIIRKFSNEYYDSKLDDIDPCEHGSMHNFHKINHISTADDLYKEINTGYSNSEIITPIYPFKTLHAKETLELIINLKPNNTTILLIYIKDLKSAEINMLFQYYKISLGLNFGIEIFFGDNVTNIDQWSDNYTYWSDMDVWEQRENLSLFYEGWVQEWIAVKEEITVDNTVSSYDLLFNTRTTIDKIFQLCNLTKTNEHDLDSFLTKWREKQQYVIDEYAIINNIVDKTINNEEFNWTPLNIIAESIIQRKLRSQGYEIKCWQLNEFPTNALELNKLLTRIKIVENNGIQ